MVIRLLIWWAVIASAIGIAAALLDSVTLHGGLLALLGVSLIFAAFVISVLEAVLGFVVGKLIPPAS